MGWVSKIMVFIIFIFNNFFFGTIDEPTCAVAPFHNIGELLASPCGVCGGPSSGGRACSAIGDPLAGGAGQAKSRARPRLESAGESP